MPVEPVWLVPHTHWDREWYEPFQRFRLRLVDLMDDVVARAEADPAFHFTLDGQVAVVDDYLEVRPEAAPRIAALVASGQFAIGPWAILMDEFLCSGESIVRNLEWGLRRAADLGGAMPVGYLPDMFGHCAQIPQIPALAGLRHACVWRGVPASVDRHAFAWHAPDGTAVRTEYLPGGYGNATELVADPERFPVAASEHAARARPWFGGDPVLAMAGFDHSAPPPWLASAVRSAGGGVRLSTLERYLELFDPSDLDGLPVWHGELRSHARANILPGVLSSRPRLKRALSAAERLVERYAEPLAARWQPADRWPARLLELAWQRLVQSSCHDSVTGCGADETATQVAARIAEAEQIGRAVVDRTVESLAATVPADAVLLVNPSPAARRAVVAVEVAAPHEWPAVALRLADGALVPFQETGRNESRALLDTVRPAGLVASALRNGTLGLEFLPRTPRAVEITGPRELTVTVGRSGPGITTATRELADLITEGEWRLRILEEPLRTGYAAAFLPPLGFQTARAEPAPAPEAEVHVAGHRLTNGRLTVDVAGDGTLTLSTSNGVVLTGVGRLSDGGDRGDLYNYAPDGRPPLDEPSSTSVTVLEAGPLVGAIEVRRTYPWRVTTEVSTRVELRHGEPFCRLDVAFTNRHPDHRTRLHVPLAHPATESHAEGQFAVVTRGRTAEGGHGEEPLPTFPAYSFVAAGGAAVLLDQVTEYELLPGELALTLLRATGLISRPDHPLRPEPAGPVVATPEAQLIDHRIRATFAVMPYPGTWESAGVLDAAEAYRHPPLASRGSAAPGGELSRSVGLAVRGDGVVMTSLRRRDARWLEARVVAMTSRPTTVHFGPVAEARLADLLGKPGAAIPVHGGAATLPLRPWQIATIQLRTA
ncbi:glycoside hydrolase family 38 N-terminal domain-containing protein [Phytohabitans kaempferiae]|uniref:Glycoside hydrolase family 38 C-terminal domain-containing protein n=1 Tax=Phytohabitans kaempferiae TaxID=1620943 RepID=A0ABV6MCG5_9ACTN